MKQNLFSFRWDEQRVEKVRAHDERQPEEEAVAEDEASGQTMMEVPAELVPTIREFIAIQKAV